jgi:uncharacterized protein
MTQEISQFAFLGLMLGLAGNIHCVGMCGPIALALPTGDAGPVKRCFFLSLYSFGRVLTYTILGIVFGILGFGVKLAGMQQILSILVGLMLIFGVFLPYLIKRTHTKKVPWTNWVNLRFGQLLRKTHPISFLGMGLINGLLPCGLVYTALAGASVSGSVQGGVAFMSAFGLGTVPALFAMAWVSRSIPSQIRTKLTKIIPIISIILGILFILRGLGLGIPMISPPTQVLQLGLVTGETCH